jgi:hypothetical protein
MIKLSRFLLVLIFILSSVTPVLAGQPVSQAADDRPEPVNPALLPNPLYIPLVVSSPTSYTITGKVIDTQANPLQGATVTDSSGATATTNGSGVYILLVQQGDHALAPEKSGYMFTPSVSEVSVTSNVTGQDFTALSACSQALVNGGFESNTWWIFPASDWPAVYSTDVVHGGARSVRTGILNSWENRYSYSSIRTQVISLPAGAAGVNLRLWLYPRTAEAVDAPLPPKPDGDSSLSGATAYDAQYVMVLDDSNQLLETLMWMRSNSSMWTYYTFDLTKWSGRSIKLEIGTYNDGGDGVTSMYVDDASLEICGGSEPLPDASCGNRISNSSFEYNGDWGIPTTPYPAGYSYDFYYSGFRSMRTGIPMYSYTNRYSYSDAWQTVYIPANATSARLRMKLLPMSQEALSAEGAQPPPAEGAEWGKAPLAYDAQYILILDPYTGYIRETLLWWQPMNAYSWIPVEYNLLKYAGQWIRIQFGTYNDGYNGHTVMYVDDAVLDTCTTTPPTVCSERVANNGFENGSAWYIPYTAYSAGYSTFIKHTGLRSMRTGIYYYSHNRYSYSDFRQTVNIPASSSSATLSFWAYPISGEAYYAPVPERPTSSEFGQEAMSGDVQYLLILDYWGNWIDTLLWQRSNAQYWQYYTFNLIRYAGSTIKIQFGTYNNGYGGVTSMYVDDVSLWACP